MEPLKLIIAPGEEGRIDRYLATHLKDVSRSQVQQMIERNEVTVNGKNVKPSYLLESGDVINVSMAAPKPAEVAPEDIPLDIYYEDSDIIVVNKPSGMVVHPASGNYEGTLVNALMHHCHDLSGINGIIRAGIVHRIDKDTSGLLVACKNDFSHRNLSKQFEKKDVSRRYYAIVHGVIPHNYGKIDAPIGRSPVNRKLMAVVEGGKPAVTHFTVIERFKNYTLVELRLETGRTHQIRVHMKYIGYPVTGDPQYGPKKTIAEHGQYLHAKTLGFKHPRTGQYMEWEAPLPDYFLKFLDIIRQE